MRKRRLLPIVGWVLGIGGTLAFMLIAFGVEENWRAGRVLAQTEADLREKGEKLETKDFISEPIAAENDFARAPFVLESLAYAKSQASASFTPSQRLERMKFRASHGIPRPALGGAEIGRVVDLAGWNAYLHDQRQPPGVDSATSARSILDWFRDVAPEMDALSAAARRPAANFPIDLEKGPELELGHESLLNGWSDLFALRAVAALRAGETQIAWRDVETLNRLQAALQKEPLLISLLVRATILAKLEQPVWEGVVDRRWSAAQLQQLQDLLGRIDLTRDYLWAVRGERAYARAFYKFEQARRAPTLAKIHALAPFETLPRALEWAFLLLPLNATFDQNEAMHERWMQSLALPLVDSRKGIVLPRNADQIERTIKGSASTPYNVLAKLSLKILPPIARRTGAALAVAREAQVACAIARFCLTNERSPATLAELVPRFLREIPSDPINGGALLYLIEPNEKYRLYSVGWNQVDDGGKIALRNSTRRDDEKGDWVWLSAPR